MISSAQCRAARALLDMTQEELAALSEISVPTIKDFERGHRQPYKRTLKELVAVFEARGVQFLEDGAGGRGVMHKAVEAERSIHELPE